MNCPKCNTAMNSGPTVSNGDRIWNCPKCKHNLVGAK